MFEDSTFESSGKIHTRSQCWSIATLALNASILAAFIVIPLIYPEALPARFVDLLLTAPPLPPAAPKPPETKPAQAFQGRPELTPLGLTVPRKIPPFIKENAIAEAPLVGSTIPGVGDSSPFPSGTPLGNGAPQPRVVSAAPKGPQRISQGVAEGMLLDRVLPVYPPIARAAGVQGTVVLEATISTSGTITNLHVVSGNRILQQAAIDAVSRWRHRPYLLNGQPVEVETTVSVVFNLGP